MGQIELVYLCPNCFTCWHLTFMPKLFSCLFRRKLEFFLRWNPAQSGKNNSYLFILASSWEKKSCFYKYVWHLILFSEAPSCIEVCDYNTGPQSKKIRQATLFLLVWRRANRQECDQWDQQQHRCAGRTRIIPVVGEIERCTEVIPQQVGMMEKGPAAADFCDSEPCFLTAKSLQWRTRFPTRRAIWTLPPNMSSEAHH